MPVKIGVATVVRAADAEFYPFQRLVGSGRRVSKHCSFGAVSVGSRRIAANDFQNPGLPESGAVPDWLQPLGFCGSPTAVRPKQPFGHPGKCVRYRILTTRLLRSFQAIPWLRG
jgi:hypothetical protein